ncbi:MAG: DUF6460 domain-containing protein [Ahrensia sp.]|nr:DUF6460 domain-containing protein [Ahrensia sp.]
MSNAVTRFLGDSPLRVFIKLVILSILVGMTMSFFDIRPMDVVGSIVGVVERIWRLGFSVLYDWLEYLALGAAIVVPAFLLIRLLSYRSPRA